MKILILRFSSIGDIVLTTPVVRCLKKQLGAEIHFLTKTAFAPIFAANPFVDQVFSFQKEISSDLVTRLKSERYDQVIDLHHNLRSLRLKLRLGRPAHSFDKLNWEKWLLVNFKIDRMPDLHIVHRYMATVQHLGVAYDGEGLDYFIPEGENLDNIELPGQPFVAFVLGATHATKRLPEEKIIEICQRIAQPIVLLGGKTEQETGERISTASGAHVLNLCARLSLHQSACVVRASSQVITHDTGLMHIAAALRKPIVSVWGSTVPKFGMGPFYPRGMDLNTTVEVSGLRCRPCSKIGFDRCPKGHFKCMRAIESAPIASIIKP
ncbi:MAG: glycosyltransferase family 9 protein [Saprospiraceae bacterium]|nr:glycosyltransferase family 9 protein [Saprospiraceae bacterium]